MSETDIIAYVKKAVQENSGISFIWAHEVVTDIPDKYHPGEYQVVRSLSSYDYLLVYY